MVNYLIHIKPWSDKHDGIMYNYLYIYVMIMVDVWYYRPYTNIFYTFVHA